VRFVPIRYKPNASTFKDEECGGINIIITNRDAFNSVRTGVEIAVALHRLYAAEWQVEKYLRLLVNQEIFDAVKRGESAEDVWKAVNSKNDEFAKRRALYLLYK
jgi:uncharacterized protein YbbC (DUF1343 family)